ncbi:rhodanese-like domain-containing protein [Tessaracoccus oleiagri]|uniref:Rhodanese-related sulfurtransferase n=1 Tax=Tessaracoccus oleiagri TaxID=686624 RepID=A0A1G9LTE0_9ACTN|nr:rhodanese-like domain-containing protein [Tessaracoccus oleiagri]SDL65362.1 Rhodanese-related sulfurtransferase [Tessaracoccus oleiagri]
MNVTRSLIIGAAIALITATACNSTPGAGRAATAELDEQSIVLDVRTPAEYAEGHLDGARLLDLTGGQFEASLPELDPDAEYFVYCRSGNRSSQAVAMMERAGFTDVTNLGSVQQAADATGLPIVG